MLVRDGGNATDLLVELRDYFRPRPEYSAPMYTRVLVLCAGQWGIGVRRSVMLGEDAFCFWFDDSDMFKIKPSHWLPLPPAPAL